MIVLDGMILFGLAAFTSSIAGLIWAIRRDPKGPSQ